MKVPPRIRALVALSFASAGGWVISGCGMMNDNPTSADKMQQIRKQEAAQRSNFNPTGKPPSGR